MAEIVWRPPQSELPWELVAVMVEEGQEISQKAWFGILGDRVRALLRKLPQAQQERMLNKAADKLQTPVVYSSPEFAGETLVEENERLQNLLRITDDSEWPQTVTQLLDPDAALEMTEFLKQDTLEDWVYRAVEYLDG